MIARLVALIAAAAVVIFGTWRGTWAVGGSDSSCYALMAEAFANGQLQPESALAVEAPWPDASRTLAPGGFVPSPVRPRAASPICTPGLSLLLAPLRAVGGRDGIFLLTPLAGGLLVWLTFRIGRALATPAAGAAATILTAATPVLLFQVVQPMNDVVVATLWTAVVAVLVGGRIRPEAVGALTGLAVLVRPNLAPAAAIVAGILVWREGLAWRTVVRFGAALVPFVAAVAALNDLLYGHPLASGYGSAVDLFSLQHVPANVGNYGSALLTTQLGLPALAVCGVIVLPPSKRPHVWLVLALAATVASIYLLYTPFAEWWYLRFFLPVLPALTAVAAAVVVTVVRRAWILALVSASVVAFTLSTAAVRQATDLSRLEQRFRTTGAIVRDRLPTDARFLTVWESGSVRYHAGREAVLWDALDPGWLDRAIAWMTASGGEVFIVVEEWEEPLFRARFAPGSPIGALDWPPRFDIDRQVRIFSPSDRARYLAGERVVTEIVRSRR